MKFLSKIKEVFSIVRNLHAFINDVIVYNRKVLMVDLLYKQTTNKGISNNLFKTNLGGQVSVTVSLTSYGKRAHQCYRTIESIMQNTILPNRIILWLAEDEFSEETIPANLVRLKERGLEIGFCKDIRSYKKLVPSLKKFPNDVIITIDDDVIYHEETIEILLKHYAKDPHSIWAFTGSKIMFAPDGTLLPYVSWYDAKIKSMESDTCNFPTGVGGILYPPNSLDIRVIDDTLFMKLCPTADDVWFKACSLIKHTECKFVFTYEKPMEMHTTVRNVQDMGLFKQNVEGCMNDKYIRGVFEYFGIDKATIYECQ